MVWFHRGTLSPAPRNTRKRTDKLRKKFTRADACCFLSLCPPLLLSLSTADTAMRSPFSFFRTYWDHEPSDRAVASWTAPALWRFRLAGLRCQSARTLEHWRTPKPGGAKVLPA